MAQSGKDTAAQFLVEEFGYGRIAFGDPLKEELAKQLVEPTQDWLQCLRENYHDVLWSLDRLDYLSTVEYFEGEEWEYALRYMLARKPVFRRYMQLYGTEFRRAKNPDYWVNLAAERMDHGHRYVITDVRFQNEADFIHSCDGALVYVRRDVAGATNGVAGHASERPDLLAHDFIIDNNGTLEDLRKKVLDLAPSLATCAR